MESLPNACRQTIERLGVQLTTDVLVVSINQQRLHWFQSKNASLELDPDTCRRIKTLICSTSKFGIGQQENSNCTPLGLHAIREKIGDGCPAGTIFKGRKPVGIIGPDTPDAMITTRILWLAGLEPGFNQGGTVDSHNRYIYIHGTGDALSLGKPASHGCIHLGDGDLIPLFDQVTSGTLVWIEE